MNIQKVAEVQQLESSLSSSVAAYEEVLGHMGRIDKEIGTNPGSNMGELNREFVILQNKAKQTDLLVEQSRATCCLESTDAAQSLDNRRRHLIDKILLVNKRLTEKAKTLRAFIIYERKRLGNGLVAMNGYRQQSTKQGRVVNNYK